MEADWVTKRSMLRHLITLHPTWTTSELALGATAWQERTGDPTFKKYLDFYAPRAGSLPGIRERW